MLTAALVTAAAATTWAQTAAQPKTEGAAGDAQTKRRAPLSKRYRLHERYFVGEKTPPLGTIGQYRVGLRDTWRTARDRPDGAAPDRTEITWRMIFEERPAVVSSLDDSRVTDVVRRYESVSCKPDLPVPPKGTPKPFEDLTVWYRTVYEDRPQIMVLSPGRNLSDIEYDGTAAATFVPELSTLLSELPVRVGDTWPIDRAGATALLSRDVRRSSLKAKLMEVLVDAAGSEYTAYIDIAGKASVLGSRRLENEVAVHAELRFVFELPEAPAQPAQPAAGGGAVEPARDAAVDAVGRVRRVALAQEETTVPDPDQPRLRATSRRELVLQRDSANIEGNAISIPSSPPLTTPDNSWLTFSDPKNRYHFRHPQTLRFDSEIRTEPDTVAFTHRQSGTGGDTVLLTYAPKADLAVDAVKKRLEDQWRRRGFEIIPGDAGFLPDADWPGMRVYRVEASLKAPETQKTALDRLHVYGYVVQTGRDHGLIVQAMTPQDPPDSFRENLELFLHSFRFGPPNTASEPSPTPPAGTEPGAKPPG